MAKIGTIEIDASLAKKSINDLQKELREAKKALNELSVGSDEFREQAEAVQDLEGKIKDVNAQMKSQQSAYDTFQRGVLGSIQGMVGGAQSVVAAMQLFGTENEDVLKSLQKMQALMAFTQGLQSFKQLSGALNNVYKSIVTTNTALGKTKAAIASTGIGLLIIALATLYTNWEKVSTAVDNFCNKTLGNGWTKIKDFFKNFDDKVAEVKGSIIGALENISTIVGGVGNVIGTVLNPKNWFTEEGQAKIKSALEDMQKSFEEFGDDVAKSREEALGEHANEKALTNTKKTLEALEESYKRDEEDYATYLNKKISLLQKQIAQEKALNGKAATETLSSLKQVREEREKHNKEVVTNNIEITKLLKDAELANIADEKQRTTQSIKNNIWYWQQKIKIYTDGSKEYLELQKNINEAEKQLLKENASMLLQGTQPQAVDTSALLQNMQQQGQSTDNGGDFVSELQYKRDAINEMLYELDTQLLAFNEIAENSTTVALESITNATAQYGDSILTTFEKASQGIEATTDDIVNATTAAIAIAGTVTSEILANAISQQDTTSKSGFEKAKKLQIAQATIQMLTGVATAMSGAFTTKTGPWDLILAATQAATITASGLATIAQIKKQKYDSGDSSVSVSSSASDATTSLTASDISGVENTADLTQTMSNIKVYVTEADITNTQNKVQVIEENNSF